MGMVRVGACVYMVCVPEYIGAQPWEEEWGRDGLLHQLVDADDRLLQYVCVCVCVVGLIVASGLALFVQTQAVKHELTDTLAALPTVNVH